MPVRNHPSELEALTLAFRSTIVDYSYTEDEPQTPTYARGTALPLFKLSNGVPL